MATLALKPYIIILFVLMTSVQCQQTAEDWYNKGFALKNQSKYNEAIKAYDEAIRLDPNYALAWNNKGAALFYLGKYNESIIAYSKAIDLNPKNARSRYGKATAISKLGKLANSQEFGGEPSYVMEIQTNSNRFNPGDNFSLGICFEGSGNVDYNKLRINIPNYIIQEGTLISRTEYFGNESTRIALKGSTFIKILPELFFSGNNSINELLINQSSNLSNVGGVISNGEYPYRINFTISPNAPAGDHYIYATLYYKNNGKWYVNEKALQIHINNWYESIWIEYLTIITLLLGIVIGFIEIFKFNRYLKDEREKKRDLRGGTKR